VLQISLLGPLEVKRDGRVIRVPVGKASELLVRLALDVGLLVRADRLVDDLWGDAVETRRNTLQSKVAMLRQALGDSRLIVSAGGGYRLLAKPSEVDALAVVTHAVAALGLLGAGDDRGAADLCESTLQMYRGELLQAAGEGDWVSPHRARLEETRMTLLEIKFSALLRLGDIGEVIGGLEAAVTTYPFQERLWELLITALYRAGRQADALAAYQRVRQQLGEQLGLDPGPQLRRLEQQILTQDASLASPPRASRHLKAEPPAGNLPSMYADLVGREPEVDALVDLVAANRLVSITGPGGIGKTALAIAVGHRLTSANRPLYGTVWLARLETATTATDVIEVLIAAMDVPGEAALIERLKGTVTLVILDNCEHVIDAAAALAIRLLDTAPGLRVLCTSQVRLEVDGEALFEVAPLALPHAVELFTRRANTQRPTGPSGWPAGAVFELCRSLDGLPLAIELAAARTKTLSIEEITRRLGDRFDILSDPTSRRPARRRSLRSTIRWSYELLFPDDQRGLWALAVFAGGAPLPAVEFVLGSLDVPAAAAIDVVSRLTSRSLVIVDHEAAPPSLITPADHRLVPSVRYRLLDSIRAFAFDAMSDAQLSQTAQAAHATWFAEVSDSSTPGVRSSDQSLHLSFVRAERANIDAALAWSGTHDPLLALRIVNGFGWAWVVLGDSRGAERILAALGAATDGAPRDRATALLLAAWIEASTGRLELASDHIEAATELANTVHDIDLQARCAYYLAYVESHHGNFDRALELTDRSRALYDGLDRPWDQAANWLFAARAAISAGDNDRSAEAVECAQHWLGMVDDPWLHVRKEATLGEFARLQHRFDDAVQHIARAAQTSRTLGFQQTEAYQVASLGRAQCQAGAYDVGALTLQLAIDKAEAIGDVRLAALANVHLGRVLRAVGQVGRARIALEAAASWHRDAGGGEQSALGECLLAALDAADGVAGAENRLVSVLDDARRRGDAPVEVLALDALARAAAAAGDVAVAGGLCDAADLRMTYASHFITELDRSDARVVRQFA
jgi:predicted ATPase/DNA-binding SARP family transcriptional activator